MNDVPISNEISLETLEDEAIVIEFDVTDNFGTIENYKIITDPLNGSLSSQSREPGPILLKKTIMEQTHSSTVQ